MTIGSKIEAIKKMDARRSGIPAFRASISLFWARVSCCC